jgi:crotonobetainyl-CoA:carnitine CoA-transferase CaiB-like acyl-CoA transferase
MSECLAGVRVVDLTRYAPGPYCTMLLGDLGADVVKVEEPPIGDPTRAVPPGVGETSAVFAALNRNKRSLVVDLRSDDGAAVVRRLASSADVLVEGFRPGTLARRGLGAGSLTAENPRLVYCSVTGYGQDGPLAAAAGHDIDYQARAGLLARPEAGGAAAAPVAPIADMAGALVATIGILAAVFERERTGRGRVVDVSLLESALALMSVPAARRLAAGGAWDELEGAWPGYAVYRCRDGRDVAVGALEPKFWEALCTAAGVPELEKRQWDRAGRDECRRTLASVFSGRDRDDWVGTLRGADACVEPVLGLDEAIAQPQVVARGGVEELEVEGGRARVLASPVRLGGARAAARRPPGPGEHTDEVLREAGLAGDEIARLRADGVVQ